MKLFIFNADDLGLTKKTTNGILDCYPLIKSASLFVTTDSVGNAYKLAKLKGISVGIHLNVTGPGKFFIKSDLFGKKGGIYKKLKDKAPLQAGEVDLIFREFDQQLSFFRKKFKVNPSHINFHHPLHKIPGFTEPFRTFIKKVRLPTRWFGGLGNVNVSHPDHTEFGFYNKPKIAIDNFQHLMNQAPEGITEFVLHPGYLDEKLDSSYKYERQMQIGVFKKKKLVEYINQNHWKIINFDEIR